ncbi:SpaH/EbpB family LPXTG-anchored major pilin [Gardnerella vaginalis]|uniref:SpaH/EbpB family LPXTG-anchored major pilin n=1 Tax=Gardnerella vaginalis TaxID=2702 RepID=UPI00157302CF|nr:SpaH/EbpB family LPXTG-anchored major pilin [Gardnerella vaginalis]
MNKFTKQCVAAVASLAMAGTLCVAGAVVAGSSAWAVTPEKAPWDLGNTAAQKKGSITITKYRDELKQGSTTDQAKKTKLENAKFKVTKVKSLDNANLDLTKYDEWLKVAAKVTALNTDPNTTTNIGFDNPVTNAAAPSSQNDKTLFVTNAQGTVKIGDLGIGLYKIEEVEAPKDHQKLSKPFFMTIPEVTSTDGKTNSYKYDVTVEPKDLYTGDAIHKYADTKNFIGVKDDVTYTIKSKVSSNSQTEVSKFTKDDLVDFAIWDDVPTNAFAAAKTAVTKVALSNNETTSFAAGDYTVEEPVDGTGTGTGKNGIETGYSRLKVKFNDSGLTKIADAYAKDPTITVNVTLKFTLKESVTSGKIVNKFGMQGGHRKGENPPVPVNPNPNPESEVTVRDFQIKKVNGSDTTKVLQGAKFAIFTTQAAADKCAKDANRTEANCKVTDYAKGFARETATANTGFTTAFKAKVGEEFYVVETQAPTGFVLSPAVEKVKIQEQGDGWNSTNKIFTYTFKDLPNGGPDGGKNWFTLPKTGAAGVIIFALIGLGLVGSGMFVFLKNRKKEEEQQAA